MLALKNYLISSKKEHVEPTENSSGVKKIMNFGLTIDDTSIIKGIAICLMLWHHLFYQHSEYGWFVHQTAHFGKVCVSLFLFVSAYGLTVQYGKVYEKPMVDTIKFQAKRFVKFYINYWIIFLIFVPIGVFIFGRTLNIPYEGLKVIEAVVSDFLGINGLKSYNITWWFNQLIICLYFLFPFLYFLAKKTPVLLLIVSVIIWKFSLPILPTEVHNYLLVFSIGIIYTLNVNYISNLLNKINIWLFFGMLSCSLFALFFVRQYSIIPYFSGIRVDGFICLNIVFILVFIRRYIRKYGLFIFLGKHSINIYMVHTFIFYYFYGNFIYSFKYPIVIFLVLLVCSLGVSVVIEYLKKIVNIQDLVKNINQKIEKVRI